MPALNKDILLKAANEARGLAMDAVHKCSSGHLGLPLGAADVGAVLFGQLLQCDPADPKWLNRDRFILSAGHGSMFLYGWLHLSGYDLPMNELINFRQLGSHTPGHPESFETVGVESTTGPLGQGIGNAVGYALSGKMAAAKYNTAAHKIIDNHVIALAGDGCLQEGVAREAVAFAAHNALDNLILIFDSNDVTLDAMAKLTQSEDTQKLFRALGWDAVTIDGHDYDAIFKAIQRAKKTDKAFNKMPAEYRALVRYIFPGGELDHLGMSIANLERNGFEVHDVEGWREHYQRTTRLWWERLNARKAEAEAEIGAERTRMWLLYLAGCSLAFERGGALVNQTLVSKRRKGPSGLPLSREDLYR